MIKKLESYIFSGFLVILIMTIPACEWFGFGKKETPTTVAPQTTDNKIKIVDVNEEKIYKDAHIAGAVHIPYDKLEQETARWDKNTPLVTYCTTFECTESHRAAKKLKELGFTNVKVYEGGMNDWYKHAQKDRAAYPYEGSASESYLTKEVSRPESKESDLPSITADELSKQLEEARK
jgi:rhodanese-related sulfurtransferase